MPVSSAACQRTGSTNLARQSAYHHVEQQEAILEKLSTYVAAILRHPGPLAVASETVVEKTSWMDQGFEVCREVIRYHFDHGAIIERTVERDAFPSEAACAECWITYEVITSGNAGTPIEPARKTFDNACRESFWLAYHLA